jgi:ADP-heptose:LPS heptosyltransferase
MRNPAIGASFFLKHKQRPVFNISVKKSVEMKFRFMKLIDHAVGMPACFLLSLYDSLFAWTTRVSPKDAAEVKSILLIKYFGIGSIILITPAIKIIRKMYPNAKITFLTFSENKAICEMIEEIDEIVDFKINRVCRLPFDVVRLLATLRKEKFDMVYNFEFHARFPAICAYMSNSSQIREFHSDYFYKGSMLSEKVTFTGHEHVTNTFMNLVDASIPDEKIPEVSQLTLPETESEYSKQLILSFSDNSNKGHFLIGVNINASEMALERRWPRERFAALLEQMISELNVKIFLVGSPSEYDYVQSLIELLKVKRNVYNLAKRLTIKQLATFFNECHLVISNDSGPLHLADAIGVPTISFFGPETPIHYGPRGKGHSVFFANEPCSPCLNPLNNKSVDCKRENRCMTEIDPNDVFDTVVQKLDSFTLEKVQ